MCSTTRINVCKVGGIPCFIIHPIWRLFVVHIWCNVESRYCITCVLRQYMLVVTMFIRFDAIPGASCIYEMNPVIEPRKQTSEQYRIQQINVNITFLSNLKLTNLVFSSRGIPTSTLREGTCPVGVLLDCGHCYGLFLWSKFISLLDGIREKNAICYSRRSHSRQIRWILCRRIVRCKTYAPGTYHLPRTAQNIVITMSIYKVYNI